MYGVGALGAPRRSVGFAPITTCPHCSKLIDGSCEICGPEDPHPSCEFCQEGRIVLPWHRNELVVAIATTVIVSVASAIMIGWINSKIQKKSKRKN